VVLFAASVAYADPGQADAGQGDPGQEVTEPEVAADPRGKPADPSAVVAIGDGLVAGLPSPGSPAEEAAAVSVSMVPAAGGERLSVEALRTVALPPSMPGGWVPVLADCLEERAPQRFSVVDRAVSAETLVTARKRVSAVRELAPGFVVVTLGAQEITAGPAEPGDLKQLRGELDDLVGELLGKGRKAARPTVLLLSMVPANLAQAGGPPDEIEAQQREVDLRISSWNEALAQVAKGSDSVAHVNLLADWPQEAEARARLTEGGWTLSDQGHARVAAAVCDAILASKP
jgi:lysophospholipase L1-like esterase